METATLSEYRRVGDDTALLTIEVPAADAASLAQARLHAPGFPIAAPEPIAVIVQPGTGVGRLIFAVDRTLPGRARHVLEVQAGQFTFAVPEPTLMPTVGAPDTDLAGAALRVLRGEELIGWVTTLERRTTVAERVAADYRVEANVPRKMAQAFREISDVRAMLDERESDWQKANERVEVAGAVSAAAERRAIEAEDERAEAVARAAGADVLRERLATAIAEADELATERDEAQAALEDLRTGIATAVAAAEEWSVEAERARAHLAAAVARAEELERERDEAVTRAGDHESRLAAAHAGTEEAAGKAGTAEAERQAATQRADELQAERDDAVAAMDGLRDQLEAAQAATEEAERSLESERTLFETRIVSGVEAERRLHLEVQQLTARLGEKRKARSEALRRPPEFLASSVTDAQRDRLDQSGLQQQRDEVAALERQLERLRHPGDVSATDR